MFNARIIYTKKKTKENYVNFHILAFIHLL